MPWMFKGTSMRHAYEADNTCQVDYCLVQLRRDMDVKLHFCMKGPGDLAWAVSEHKLTTSCDEVCAGEVHREVVQCILLQLCTSLIVY